MASGIPALAARTFSRLKDTRSFRKICERIGFRLQKITSFHHWAQRAHEEVDHQLSKDLSDPLAVSLVTCRRGCSACCHTQVSCTIEEASLLAKKVQEKGLEINMTYLEKQAMTPAERWYGLTYDERKCVFVNSAGECSLYEDRPSVCRSNYVISNPIQCDTSDGVERPLRMLKTERADMAIVGQFRASKKTGTLPSLLYEVLLARKNQ